MSHDTYVIISADRPPLHQSGIIYRPLSAAVIVYNPRLTPHLLSMLSSPAMGHRTGARDNCLIFLITSDPH